MENRKYKSYLMTHSTPLPYHIRQARPDEAAAIATLIMEAMNHDCCQWFAGPQHTLEDFHRLMTALVQRTDSQYSYLNTWVAIADEQVVAVCVAYDGAKLHELREAFISGAREAFGIDYTGMDDETQADEFYVDSLCVSTPYRRQGIASALLRQAITRSQELGIPSTGLLVDAGNPNAERLYTRLGFVPHEATSWGSHPMRHMVWTSCSSL